MRRVTSAVWLPLLIAVAGITLVLSTWASARPLWLDEEMIAINLRDHSLSGRLWLDQSAPLGWFALQKLVLLAFGPSELALRAVPALFGAATVLAAFFVGQRWLTTAGCAIFVLLCSIGEWVSFYAVELKPYSADTFWGVCLPALAAAVAADSSVEAWRKSLVIWGIAAAIAHWFSLGAALLLPACFVVLAMSIRRHRERLGPLAVASTVVIASFAVHYLVSIRHTRASESLQQFWKFALPPDEAGLMGSLQWLYNQLEPFALKPGGTRHAILFWISAILGVAFGRARPLGFAAGLVALSGFALAAMRIMPLYERLSLWMVPALYLSIALVVDRSVWFLRRKPLEQRWMNVAAAGIIVAVVGVICADVVILGVHHVRFERAADSNHNTDDRAAIAWLLQQRQPGDALITTRHALPAIWWYGGVRISEAGGGQFSDGGRIFEAEYYESHAACQGYGLETAVNGRRRIQVYLGFADTIPGFDDLLLERLSTYGTITAVRHFGGASRAAVIDRSIPGGSNLFWEDAGKDTGMWLKGCIAAKAVRAW